MRMSASSAFSCLSNPSFSVRNLAILREPEIFICSSPKMSCGSSASSTIEYIQWMDGWKRKKVSLLLLHPEQVSIDRPSKERKRNYLRLDLSLRSILLSVKGTEAEERMQRTNSASPFILRWVRTATTTSFSSSVIIHNGMRSQTEIIFCSYSECGRKKVKERRRRRRSFERANENMEIIAALSIIHNRATEECMKCRRRGKRRTHKFRL